MTIVNYDWDEDEDNIVEEYDDVGTIVAEYTTEPGPYGNVISQRRSGLDSVYHFDGVGSTLALTNANSDVTDTYAYAVFGESTMHAGSTVNPFQYIGQKEYFRDIETGEFSVRRRYLSSILQRWLSFDPLILMERLLHLYVYANNSPASVADPSGLWCAPDFAREHYAGLCDLIAKTVPKEIKKEDKSRMISEGEAPAPKPISAPTLSPEDKKACNARMLKLLNNPIIKDVLGKFDGYDCQKPLFTCSKCGNQASYRHEDRLIRVCWNNIMGETDAEVIGTLVHEMTHALQNCYYSPPKVALDKATPECLKSLMFEIEASYCGKMVIPGKRCVNFEQCLGYAIGSSCYGKCTGAQLSELYPWLKNYYDSTHPVFCMFPRFVFPAPLD
jgi:RHS repeat-associated protein